MRREEVETMSNKKIGETEKKILDTFEKLFPLLDDSAKEKLLHVAEGACLFKMLQAAENLPQQGRIA